MNGRNADGLGSFPTSENLLGQGFDFRPAWWTERVRQPAWTAFLLDLPEAEQGREYRHISRRDMLAAATGAQSLGPGRTLVAAYAWGTGMYAFLVGRRARVFRDNPRELVADRLADACQRLLQNGPVAAYRSLSHHGDNKLKHLGPSFFTKFLYAADFGGLAGQRRALILDRFVAIGLNASEGWNLSENGPWAPGDYGRWIEYAHKRAARASAYEQREVRADAVELAIFNLGRRLVRARARPR